MLPISKIGVEVEFNQYEEDQLQKYFEAEASGYLYDWSLTRKRAWGRLYKENSTIYEYRARPIGSESYLTFIKFFYGVSKYSCNNHPAGYYDDTAGSMHTHISFKEDLFNYGEFAIKAVILLPFMPRYTRNGDLCFRYSQPEFANIYNYYFNYGTTDIPSDSKDYWLCYNSISNSYEYRVNENIPAWYILYRHLDEIDTEKHIIGYLLDTYCNNVRDFSQEVRTYIDKLFNCAIDYNRNMPRKKRVYHKFLIEFLEDRYNSFFEKKPYSGGLRKFSEMVEDSPELCWIAELWEEKFENKLDLPKERYWKEEE